MLAICISLIVNFSYLLVLVINQENPSPRRDFQGDISKSFTVEGVARTSVDGFGYIITEDGDSVYIPRQRCLWLEIQDGETLKVDAISSRHSDKAHPIMSYVIERNGKQFDYGPFLNSPAQIAEMIYQIFYYILVSLLMLQLATRGVTARKSEVRSVVERGLICLVIGIIAYFLAPITLRFTQETVLLYKSGRLIDFIVMLKSFLISAVVLLYSQIQRLNSQREKIVVENEMLKTENLSTKYNMLVSQVNPHFLFNSLSSLSSLVREGDKDKAINYIDQLSYTFRYITQNSSNSELVELSDELDFARAYCYLIQIRYADKISFDIDIDDKYKGYRLPALSIQPLLGNAVKHNTISSKNPMTVRIYVENMMLVVENPKHPLLSPNPGTGTGLRNLNSRYELIDGQSIVISENESIFKVSLPLYK